jgi:peptidoglycan/LPS O-acetylase OafA/YrhL
MIFMFGIYRTLLALAIVGSHLAGLWWIVGHHLLYGFYILSGYLMTLIMHKNYGYNLSGMWYFAVNRFLRVYPVYRASCLFSLCVILIVGQDFSTQYLPALFIPNDTESILRNVALIFDNIKSIPRLSPPAWALTVELFFYAAICLGISRNRTITWIWLIASILYHVFALYTDLSFKERYFPIYAASLPFALGAMAYLYRAKLNKLITFSSARINQWVPMMIVGALMVNWIIGHFTGELKFTSYYVSMVFASFLVLALSDKNFIPNISRELDRKIGDLSYPVYLTHLPAGLLAFGLITYLGIDGGANERLKTLAIGYVIVLPLSWAMAVFISEPVDNIRETIKKLLARSSARFGTKTN